jgi:hypothetical protein
MEPCLYDLAAENQLTDHQYMDRRTLDWISSYEPLLFDVESPQPLNLPCICDSLMSAIAQFSPSTKWYAHPSLVQSLHGLRHTLRVVVNARLLTSVKGESESEILIASSLHDLRRNNDRHDAGHGMRAAEWWTHNASSVLREYRIDKVDESLVYDLIRFHDLPFDDAGNADLLASPSVQSAIETMRLADALDRYRLPKVKWWINDKCMKLPASRELKQFSFRLMLHSERSFLNGISSLESVRSAITSVFDSYL